MPQASSTRKKSMNVKKLIDELEAIRSEHGDDIRVLFDTEAARYFVHCVPVDYVILVPDPSEGGSVAIIGTQQDESRRH